MITYNRPHYTRLALRRLLETCDEACRVWVWHNGNHEETLEVVRSQREHPRFHKFHHCPENLKLWHPTNWIWQEADGWLVGKVDDDVLMPHGWIQKLRQAHERVTSIGALSAWNYGEEDFDEHLASSKIRQMGSDIRVLVHSWIGGGSYLMKRECISSAGLLGADESFLSYCVRLTWLGWKNGWLVPIVFADHMDDPRSQHTLLKSDADLVAAAPLTPAKNGAVTLAEWTQLITDAARYVQTSRAEPCRLFWLRKWPYRVRHLASSVNQKLTDGTAA